MSWSRSSPTRTTARRAFAVLKAWRAAVRRPAAGAPHRTVGALQDVSRRRRHRRAGTSSPTARSPGDPDAAFFDAQGMAVVGTRIAMVEMVLAGQDYDYEPGQEPMVAAVQRAARQARP